jgi:CRISPR-associated protein (TIGR02710 family)
MKGMVVTVGTGEGVQHGIAESIQNASPDFIVFVASGASRDTIGKVAEVLRESSQNGLAQLCENQDAVVEVEDPEELNSCYEACVRAFRVLKERQFQPKLVVADFTSGTKAMSAGLVMASVLYGCDKISYVGGSKRDSSGRVVKGSEVIHVIRPSIVFRDLTLANAAEAFNNYQFRACIELIEGLRKRLPNDILEKANSLETAARFYDAWDRFDHVSARDLAKELKIFDQQWKVNTDKNRQVVCQIAEQIQTAMESAKSDSNGYFVTLAKSAGDLLMADLLANAKRRGEECRYDDAVARLYRAIELAAQVVFARKFGFSTGRVPLEVIQQKSLESKYASKGDNGFLKLGLRDSYELLSDLNHSLGVQFSALKKDLLGYLNTRNESILAHGLTAVAEEVYEKLSNYVNQLCAKAASSGSFEDVLEKFQFPRLTWTPDL